MSKKGQKYQKYTTEQRIEITKKYDEGYSSYELEQKYGISNNTIRMWKYQYEKGNNFQNKKGRSPGSTDIDYKERYEILKNFQAFLKKQPEKR